MSASTSSSPAGGSEAAKSSDRSSGSLAFLVHSQDTLHHNLPPDVDNKPLLRQKRRRTSPEDQKTLEMEYQRNPKPDKAARMEIVKRVALGEKEVQIWFQNRRQNSRRKSRPLMSHEIIPHLRSSFGSPSMPLAGPQYQNHDQAELEDEIEDDENPVPPSNVNVAADASRTTDNHESLKEPIVVSTQETVNINSQATDDTIDTQADDTQAFDTQPTELGSSQPQPLSQEPKEHSSLGMGYLANRRSASFMNVNEEDMTAGLKPTTDVGQDGQASRSLTRTRSSIRLSMTSDGKAKVISDATKSPSPPRSQPAPATSNSRTGGLRRSFSAAGLSDKFKDAEIELHARKFQRTSSGRSRDSRAWEFWCDSDARNSLAEKADQENSGSAADAIGLIRSNSKNALRSNLNKRNAQIAPRGSIKRTGNNIGKPQLVRSASSIARLQSKSMAPRNAGAKAAPAIKGKDLDSPASEFETLNTESDKENWEPNMQAPRRTQYSHSQPDSRAARQILGENIQVMSQNSSLGAMLARERRRKGFSASQQNVNPEDDEEIATFMGDKRAGSSGRASASSGEDLDCVHGLLKLKQGNWR